MDRAKSDMNLTQLTEDERQAILRVLKRDQALRNMEEKRLMYMKSELHMLKKRGALKPGLDNMCNGSRCARCLTPLGLLINTGADCFVCLKKVCRSCRQYNELAPTNTNPKQWACLVCSKQMELKAASGEWMEEYKNKKSKTGERCLDSLDVVKQLVLSGGSKNEESRRAESFSNPAHVSPNISVKLAPDSRPKTDSPKFERRVQFLSGSQESSIMMKKIPGNSKLASPPVLKKRPLVRNTAVDLPNTADVSESSILSKTSKVHPEAQDRERLPVSPIFYNKCRSRRDSSSSVSTCSLSSSSVQGPSPIALRKNACESPLDIELRSKRTADESFYDNSLSRRSPSNCQKFQTERMVSDPGYERNFSSRSEMTSIKSRSLGSYDETHSLRILQQRSNNLTLGSVDNLSDATSNTQSEYSGPPSICSTYPSRPSSISPATFRRVLVSTLKDSSSSHSESEIEPTQPQFRKVSIKKNSLTEVDENAMAHRSSPRGRLRARGKALSSSSDDGINRASSGSVPQILISDHLENNSVRGSQSLSDRESIGLPEDDGDQVISPYSRSQTSLFGARSESMSSVYSAAGGGRYGAVIVTGEILFSLNYNCKAGHLALHVKECRNLAPVDTKRNRSDPYVKVYLLPDKTKGGKRKTKVKKHTLNPIFDEVLKFVVTNSELETRTMWLSVWHSDIFGRNDFLGEVMLPLSSKLVDISQSLKWYPLQERMDANESTLSYKGDIILSLKFVPPDVTSKKPSRKTSTTSVAGTKGTLHVLVKEARNLMAIRSNGTSDPFCKSYLLPDKSKSGKQKTPVVKKSCNPKWNHTFVYEDISTEELKDRCLELTIWDYDKITSNDFLGGVRMNLGTGKHQGKDVDWMDALGEELVLWRSMVDRPNQWIDAALMLRPSMSRRS